MLHRPFQIAAVALLSLLIALPAAAARKEKPAEKAEPMFPKATRAEPSIKPSSRVLSKLNKMIELSHEDDVDKTFKAAEEVLNHKSSGAYERAMAAQVMAIGWLDRDDYPKAIEAFERAISENGLPNDSHLQIMFQIAQLHVAEENYETALQWMDRFLAESGSDKPEHQVIRGNALYRMERYPEAIATLKGAIDASSEPQDGWYQMLMACYFETEQLEEAASVAETLLAKKPDDLALIRNLASIYINADLNDKAVAVLENAKAKGLLTEERDYRQLYQIYHYAEREAEAIATIEEGLASGALPPSLETYRALGEANYFAERIPQAIEAYQKAVPFAENGEIALNLARVLTEEDRWAEAKTAVNEALAKGVKRPGDAYIILGAVEFGLNNRDAAIAAYKEAAKYPETETMAKTWLRSAGYL